MRFESLAAGVERESTAIAGITPMQLARTMCVIRDSTNKNTGLLEQILASLGDIKDAINRGIAKADEGIAAADRTRAAADAAKNALEANTAGRSADAPGGGP
jgi:hypothetical protein